MGSLHMSVVDLQEEQSIDIKLQEIKFRSLNLLRVSAPSREDLKTTFFLFFPSITVTARPELGLGESIIVLIHVLCINAFLLTDWRPGAQLPEGSGRSGLPLRPDGDPPRHLQVRPVTSDLPLTDC